MSMFSVSPVILPQNDSCLVCCILGKPETVIGINRHDGMVG